MNVFGNHSQHFLEAQIGVPYKYRLAQFLLLGDQKRRIKKVCSFVNTIRISGNYVI